MTREATERVVETLMSAVAALNESARIVQAEAQDTEFRAYRKQIAQVAAAIYLDLIKPIVASYPDLDPGRENPADREK